MQQCEQWPEEEQLSPHCPHAVPVPPRCRHLAWPGSGYGSRAVELVFPFGLCPAMPPNDLKWDLGNLWCRSVRPHGNEFINTCNCKACETALPFLTFLLLLLALSVPSGLSFFFLEVLVFWKVLNVAVESPPLSIFKRHPDVELRDTV